MPGPHSRTLVTTDHRILAAAKDKNENSEIAIFPTRFKRTLQALHPGHLLACLSPNIRSILGGQAQRASS